MGDSWESGLSFTKDFQEKRSAPHKVEVFVVLLKSKDRADKWTMWPLKFFLVMDIYE